MGVVGQGCVEAERLGPNVGLSRPIISHLKHGLITENTRLSSCVVSSLLGLNVVSICVRRKRRRRGPRRIPTSPGTRGGVRQLHARSHTGIALSTDVHRHISANVRFVCGGAASRRVITAARHVTSSLVHSVGDGSTVTVSVSALGADSRCAFGRDISMTAVSVVITGRRKLSPRRMQRVNIYNLLRSVKGAGVPGTVLGGPNGLGSSRFTVVQRRSACDCGVVGSHTRFSPTIYLNILRRRRGVGKDKCPVNISTRGVYPCTGVLSMTSVCSTLIARHPCGGTCSRESTIRVVVSVAVRLSVATVGDFLRDVVLCPMSDVIRLDGNRRTHIIGGVPRCVLHPIIIKLADNGICGLKRSVGYTGVVVLWAAKGDFHYSFFVILPLRFRGTIPSPTRARHGCPRSRECDTDY